MPVKSKSLLTKVLGKDKDKLLEVLIALVGSILLSTGNSVIEKIKRNIEIKKVIKLLRKQVESLEINSEVHESRIERIKKEVESLLKSSVVSWDQKRELLELLDRIEELEKK